MFGPLGVITPYPGLTSLWPGGTPPADELGEGSLWSLASSGPTISVAAYHSTTSVIKELEGVKVIDGKLKVSGVGLMCRVYWADVALVQTNARAVL